MTHGERGGRSCAGGRAKRDDRRTSLSLLALLLLAAFALRLPVLGDWNFETDDQFYALVGHRLLAGDWLYVDVWDRKGPSLYYLFSLFALPGPSVLAFQLAGALASGLAAFGISCLSLRLGSGFRGALLSGLSYLCIVPCFGGANGQSEVFYLPFLVGAAWAICARWQLVQAGRVDGVLLLGFVAAGIAGTFKQSAYVAGLYFGLSYVWVGLRRGVSVRQLSRNAGLLALAGAAPLVGWIAVFALAGHVGALWSALVASNVSRHYMETGEFAQRLGLAGLELAAPVGIAALGWLRLRAWGAKATIGPVRFVAGWFVAGLVTILVYPNLFNYYLLILLPPLCVLASGLYAQRALGIVAFIALAGVSLWSAPAMNWPERNRTRASQEQLLQEVRGHLTNRPMLVWGSMSFLYALADKPPPSVLAFPPHLYDATEDGTGGLDQVEETARILALGPDPVVRQEPVEPSILNARSAGLVEAYVMRCQRRRAFRMVEQGGPQVQTVYSKCGGRFRTNPSPP